MRARGFNVKRVRRVWAKRPEGALRLWEHGGADWVSRRNVESYADFLSKVDADKWNASRAEVVVGASQLRQRVQEKGSCGWQAAILCLFYRQLSQDPSAEMLDLTAYALNKFTRDEIERWVINDMGVKPDKLLKSWVGEENVPIGILRDLDAATLKQTGPVVITNFQMHEDFEGVGSSYLGSYSGKFTGYHAMVIIGVREEGGEKIFLVQNLWRTKQFVEVSETYLRNCGVVGYFYLKPGVNVPSSGHFVTALRTVVSGVQSQVWMDNPRL
jgi:hypothetical protein